MASYEDLLKKGMEKVPKKTVSTQRFEVPKAKALKQGNKTIIFNIFDIANFLQRDPKHLIKFLSLELGTSYDVKDQKVSYIGNFSPDHINKKIEIYLKSYVLCTECGKPDTKLIKEGQMDYIRCEACGAKHPIKKV